MGLFDYVVTEVPLPDGRYPVGAVFQTKHFDAPFMETYTIRPDGRLVARRREYEPTPEEDLPQQNKDAPEGSLLKWLGIMRAKREWEEPLDDFHGDLTFGAWEENTKTSVRYTARFTHGRLETITAHHEHLP